MISPLVIALSLVSLAVAATNSTGTNSTTPSTNSTGIDIEAIEAHFSNAGIVPSLLTTFDPRALMTVSFTGVGNISPGQALTQTQVKPQPAISITPANTSVELGSNFTLVMVDAGPVGTDESQGQTRHWLVYGFSLNGTVAPEDVDVSNGTAITEYAGPAPDSGSGPHRYAILLYSQPSTFSPPSNLSTPDVGVDVFNLPAFVSSSNLGPIVAGMYFTVEVGTATFTPSATSAVVTSTLPIPSTSTSPASHKPSGTTVPVNNGAAHIKVAAPYLLGAFAGLVVFLM